MSKIALIATSQALKKYGEDLIQKRGCHNNLDIFLASMDSAVECAKKLDKNQYDIIISRGATAEMLLREEIGIPIVDIPISNKEVVESLKIAQAISKKSNPIIAYVGFTKNFEAVKAFFDEMDLQIIHYQVKSSEDIVKTVASLQGKVDVVIGGIVTCEAARLYRIKEVLLTCHPETLEIAYEIAERMQKTIREQKIILEGQKIIINSVNEVLINIDRNKKITMCNVVAENILNNNKNEQLIGKNILEVCPNMDSQEIAGSFQTNKRKTGIIFDIGKKKYCANLQPICVNGTPTNILISLQEVKELQKIESSIRKSMYNGGNTAKYQFEDIKGCSKQILETIEVGKKYAQTDASVFIIGETGTGKELFAQSIHNSSSRRDGPFVAVNCGAIPPSLVESELFGYEDGAFTGAKRGGKIGLLELAHRGTIFLDEISDLSSYGQVMLLRAIQERQIRRVGGSAITPIDVRIIAASNDSIFRLVEKKKFRKDLFYRLSVLVLNIPPLVERIGDIEFLVVEFIEAFNKKYHKNTVITENALKVMASYQWEGNIRQLLNFCEKIVILGDDKVYHTEDIKKEFKNSFFDKALKNKANDTQKKTENYHSIKIGDDYMNKEELEEIINRFNGNKSDIAEFLKISRTSLWRYMKQWDLQ
ncbi:MAG: sigma 54-interacting transcriptional regulator [Angelakisella sp.]|nr:sigma 54-interacting transcriptional regulator [Angelakisella sp.]